MAEVLVLNRDCAPLSILPLSAVPWARAIKGVFLGSLTVLHEYADRPLRSPSTEILMPSVVMTSRYVRPKQRISWTKENLFLRDAYTCQYCTKRFPERELTFDHVMPACMGGPTIWTNIVAACQPCNNKRGHDTRIQPVRPPYEPTYFELVARMREFTLSVPDPVWAEYLQWPEDKIVVGSKYCHIRLN